MGETSLDVADLVAAIEDFNTVFIRLAGVEKVSFSTLSVLHTLGRRGPMRLTDLVATEQIKQPALTSLVAKLSADGLIERTPDPRDGRAALLTLSPAGRHVVDSRRHDRVARLSVLTAQLSDADRAVLGRLPEVLATVVRVAAEQGLGAAVPANDAHRNEETA